MTNETVKPSVYAKGGLRGFLPWWIWIILLIEVAAPVFFATSTILDPASMFPGTEEVTPPIALYVVRNYAVAFGLILAVIFRSYTALFILVLVRMAMDVPDIINSFVIGASDDVLKMIPVFAVLFVILPAVGLRFLWKGVRAERKVLNANPVSS